MEAEQPQQPPAGALKAPAPLGEQLPRMPAGSDSVIHVGSADASSQQDKHEVNNDKEPVDTGRTPPSLIEAEAVNHNYAKHHGGEEGKNLDNPSPLEHIPSEYYKDGKKTGRMRKVDSQSNIRTF